MNRFQQLSSELLSQCSDRQAAGRLGFRSRYSTTSRAAPIQWLPRVKRPGRKADRSRPSNTEVKNSRYIPPLCPCKAIVISLLLLYTGECVLRTTFWEAAPHWFTACHCIVFIVSLVVTWARKMYFKLRVATPRSWEVIHSVTTYKLM
jgi:hypothetical protein